MKKVTKKSILRDIVVIGSSAGGLLALLELVKGLPEGFPAAILVVQHVPPYSKSNLHAILNRQGALPAVVAKDGEDLQAGKIYVAPPDHHLLIETSRILVKQGPKENRFRPSIDALFRSAAYTYGPRVIGIVLSGILDDGTSGLWSIKRLGGLALTQQPDDALFPQMAINAQQYVQIDHSVPASQMAALLTQLINQQPTLTKPKLSKKEQKLLETEIVVAANGNAFNLGIIGLGEPTNFTCPECHGALMQLKEGKIIRFRCHTGHAYTISSLISEVTSNVESILWQAMQSLEETTMLMTKLGQHFKNQTQEEIAKMFFQKASLIRHRSQMVHDIVLKQESLSADFGYEADPDA